MMMVRSTIKLTTLFHDVFDDKSIIFGPGTSAPNIEDWDSFNHINLVLAIQASFRVKFLMWELQSMESVSDIVVLIEKKLA